MKFDTYDVVYVEDDPQDWKKLNKAVKDRNKSAQSTPLRINWAQTPEKLEGLLSLSTRLVLADVFFPSNDPGGGEDERLYDIIKYVEGWCKKEGVSRLIPIIAYTGRGEEALEYCLKFKKELFDIWDKSSASPEYAAWRLSEISKELSRIRPDALTQRLIREMRPYVTWHHHVVDMTKRYDSGWSEYDQIERAGFAIKNIAYDLKVWDKCEPMWRAMVDWEALSRAVSTRTRGHARHVINVFWLGYYLLNNEILAGMFSQYWEKLKYDRKNMSEVVRDDPMEALSNAWFYAGLFHDVGGAVEKAYKVEEYLKNLLSVFGEVAPPLMDTPPLNVENFMKRAQPWLNEFDDSLIKLIQPALETSVSKNEPDQGVVAALHLRNIITEGKQNCYAREGARAMSMHNLFPVLGDKTSPLPVNWEREPLVCLLLLCDQLQTWDRERGTDSLKGGSQPSRAELSAMEIKLDENDKPNINMSIDYIAPSHLDHSYEQYTITREDLIEVLRKNPYRALNRIQTPWPFKLNVHCTLSGEPLQSMSFG
jgi:hypothetical protein